jgi:hypothetical protein
MRVVRGRRRAEEKDLWEEEVEEEVKEVEERRRAEEEERGAEAEGGGVARDRRAKAEADRREWEFIIV